MAKLRYDLVVQAITSLQRYMDTCAEEDNTLALVWDAADSVEQLKELECGVKQRHQAGKPSDSDVLSALAEVEGKIEKMRDLTEFLHKFMNTYKEEITTLRTIAASTYEMGNVLSAVRSVERQLASVRSKILIV